MVGDIWLLAVLGWASLICVVSVYYFVSLSLEVKRRRFDV
jgi:hypothetical protein